MNNLQYSSCTMTRAYILYYTVVEVFFDILLLYVIIIVTG